MFRLLKNRMLQAREEERQSFQQKYSHFRELLDRNNEVLETISLLSDIRDQGRWIGLGRLRAMLTRTAVNVYRLIQNLNHITDGQYQLLGEIFAELEENLVRALTVRPGHYLELYSLPLHELDPDMAREVGPKAANLGGLARELGMRVPRGVAFTAHAYQRFMEHQELGDHVNKETLAIEPGDLEGIESISRRLQELIVGAELPPELEEALAAGYAELQEGSGGDRPVVLRSSAVGEDERGASFAGLYRSIINPPPHQLALAYKQVVASKFSPRAITYMLQKGYYHELYPMGVLMMELVPSRCAGVMFTRAGRGPEDSLLVSAVWGLGKLAVEGGITPDLFWLDRKQGQWVLESRPGDKPELLQPRAGGGVERRPVEPGRRRRPCLEEADLARLARLGLALEEFFGCAQDVEWALDEQGELYVLQSRPQVGEESPRRWTELYPHRELARGPEPLVRDLLVGSQGVAAGRPVELKRYADMAELPEGSVVMVPNTSPDLVSLLPASRALLAQRGNTSGHLAIIAREFGLPLVIGLGPEAVALLARQEEVTVDGFTGAVFPGRVEPLLEMDEALRRSRRGSEPSPIQELLDRVLKYVTPLNLIDPRSPSFRPQSIRTIHDIVRFAHEKSINAMFEINDTRLSRRGRVVRLKSPVPLDIYLIDIGQGLAPEVKGRSVGPDQITSIPMLALYRGMTTPGVRWSGQIPIDFKGFVSVFANTMFDGAKHERRLGDRSYAIVSRHYVNFSSRLGYHFSIVDAFLSEAVHDNYISFRFKGGAASLDKRTRRVRFLQEVLERHHFWVDQKADLINARIKRLERPEMEEKLEMLGRLMGCARQLDVAMVGEKAVRRFVELFMQGDYSMGYGPQEGGRG